MPVYGAFREAIIVMDSWSLSIWDGMKSVVTEIILPAFSILDDIPLGIGSASVLDLMFGIVVIGIAISFFWRAGAATEGIASVKLHDTKNEARYQSRLRARLGGRNP